TMIGLLEPHLARPIVEAAQSITVAAADASVAEQVNCPQGDPMLRVDRLYSDAEGNAVELAVSHFLPEH
ncbi:UTRA domain-containing protein, partial [Streptomyces sp. SID10244]|nr:UTRA domain-containing protein [Streptomyces sp. SID10244]